MAPGAGVGIFTTDNELVIKAWDDWLARATGIGRDAAVGRRLTSIIPAVEARGLLRYFRDAAQTGHIHVLAPAFHHYLIKCPPTAPSKRFKEMQQRITIGPLRENDAVIGIMVAVEDVTARLDAERDLAESLAEGDGLSANNWRVRQSSVQKLATEANPEFVLSVVASLRDAHLNFGFLSSALKLLAVTNVDVTGPLVELLKDPDPDLRIQASLALGDQSDAGAVAPLIEALKDSNPNVRFQAIESLGRLRATAAVDELLAIVESRDFFLGFAALDALAAIGDPRVAPRLVPLLDAADLRTAVADALAAIGDITAVSALVAALNGTPGAAVSIAGALAAIHDRADREYRDGARIADAVRKEISPAGERHLVEAVAGAGTAQLPGLVRVLGWLRSAAVDTTLTRLLGEPTVRNDVVEALARHGEGVVDALTEQLRSDDADIQHAAVVALGRVGSKRATPALVALLSEHTELLVAAAGALARIADGDSFNPLLSLLGHPDGSVRQAAIGALNSIGHPQMSTRVAGLLNDANPLLRESAVRIAGYFGYPETTDRLFECVGDPNDIVRRAAIEHLPFLDDDRVLPALLDALAKEAPQGRAAAVRALAKVEGDSARAAIASALRDADMWVRYYAARGLADQRDTSSLDALLELAERDSAPHVRIAALNAIGALGGSAAIARLEPITRDPNDQVSIAALNAIGRLAAVDGLPALQVAVRSDDPQRRGAAVTALASQGSVDAVRALEWAAAADPDHAIAHQAMVALAQVAVKDTQAGHAAVDALITLLSDRAKRESAAIALATLPPVRISAVSPGLDHPHPEVRRGTVDALGRFQREEATRLIERALDDTAEAVRESAVAALARLGARGMRDRVTRLASEDPSKHVRRAATAALKQLQG
jgi:HEAT repeat protein